jgi:hypothetical protein
MRQLLRDLIAALGEIAGQLAHIAEAIQDSASRRSRE